MKILEHFNQISHILEDFEMYTYCILDSSLLYQNTEIVWFTCFTGSQESSQI